MNAVLSGKKVAILVADGFEESELTDPKDALEDAGAQTFIISPNHSEVRSWKDSDWSESYMVDLSLDEARPDDYDAVLLPGGVKNPDTLRMNPKAVAFIEHFIQEEKPIGAICHGPWLLIETKALRGRNMTSYKSIRTDLINAGANWTDQEVVVDNGLVTSRQPADIPAFSKKLIEEIREGRHGLHRQMAANN
jgi:protease I